MKTYIVLGMHRSSTSRIAKGLSETGVNMGENLLGAVPSNPWGHFEDIDFIRMNDAILNAAGGSWDHPPAHSAIMNVSARIKERIAALVKQKTDDRRQKTAGRPPASVLRPPAWGWKDPRTTLTLLLYLPHIAHPHLVCCFRSVAEVAQSLVKRDGGSLDAATRLAVHYNKTLAALMANFGETIS